MKLTITDKGIKTQIFKVELDRTRKTAELLDLLSKYQPEITLYETTAFNLKAILAIWEEQCQEKQP